MAVDIFLSYKSSDRPRAETLRQWFEQAGWSVWMDRGTEVGEEWEPRIEHELKSARLIVVLWGAEARQSAWVRREAELALSTKRLLQVHATGLPLLPPYDRIQSVRMQSWSGENAHSDRTRLLQAVADRLGSKLPPDLAILGPDDDVRDIVRRCQRR
jgi:TIR domain-containing protein